MKLYLNIIMLILILFVLFSTFGCNRKNKAEKEEKAQSTEQAKEETTPAKAPVTATDAVLANSDTSEVASGKIALKQTIPSGDSTINSIVNPIQAAGKNNRLLAKISEKIATPEDFEIGSLHSSNENNEYELFIIQFFENMENGNFDSLKIDEENRFFLENVFNAYIDAGQIPDNIRIGVGIKDADSSSTRFNLRLYKGKNPTEGEISLIGSGESLQVKEFYGDLSLLDVEYDNVDKKYEPEVYSFR